ncbi:class I SAM-dependent methyltransferase [Aureimonas sp. ME7]|uniref:class I SAM-dependent methyltransferase n=1 Tax=Aureimonas sp. ME7 TaxID=2744252 RepID=UPI0015F6E4F6|nr:class I SAM-dependent methyltransferase [Aureimonas sp. ME7]
MSRSQHDLAVAQFSPQAGAYVASAVHAGGADLEALRALSLASRPARALDLGTGGGHVAYALAAGAGEVVACDLSPDMIAAVEAEARRRGLSNVTGRVTAAERLPFEAGSFDLVASRFSAHHWASLSQGLSEARRVAKAGARAVFVDAVAPPAAALDTHLQAVELLRDPSHGRDYRPGEWVSALEEAGFRVETMRSWRLPMEFASWTARIGTPPAMASAVRALQDAASGAVREHFAIEADGSFLLDVAWFEAVAA